MSIGIAKWITLDKNHRLMLGKMQYKKTYIVSLPADQAIMAGSISSFNEKSLLD